MTEIFTTEPLSRDPRRAIRELLTDWTAAMRAQDVGALARMVTEDAVFLPPGFPPVRGRQAVEIMYQSFFPQFSSVEQTATLEELEVTGDWAFAWGSESLVLIPKAGGSPIEMRGKGMTILKRQPDGLWKIARGINNAMLGARV